MGKNEGRRRESNNASMREDSSRKKNPNLNAKTVYLKSLALWAVSEPSIDPSLFVCQRCESILQAGHNCTVRIEKNISKPRHRRNKKSSISIQNNVVYECHFCSHRNLLRGTPKGYVKEISTPKAKPRLKSNLSKRVTERKHTGSTIAEVSKVDNVTLRVKCGQNPEATTIPESPSLQSGLSLLDAKKRKRNRYNGKKVAELDSSSIAAEIETNVHASSKRRRKSWTSLKEIAHRSEHDTCKKLTTLTIPFVI